MNKKTIQQKEEEEKSDRRNHLDINEQTDGWIDLWL